MYLLLAEWSSGEWVAVISAIGSQVLTIVGVVLAYLKSRGNAQSIADVKTDVSANAIDTKQATNAQNQKLRVIADVVHDVKGDLGEVKTHTNGMLKQLQEVAFLAGAKSETDKLNNNITPPGTH